MWHYCQLSQHDARRGAFRRKKGPTTDAQSSLIDSYLNFLHVSLIVIFSNFEVTSGFRVEMRFLSTRIISWQLKW